VATDPESTTVVVTDANVLINFCHLERLSLFGRLAPLRFLVPQEVVDEIEEPDQRAAMGDALAAGHIEVLVISDMVALALFANLRSLMGRGEAACLAWAATAQCLIASDEKKRFRRKAVELLGESRILRTEDLLVQAIRRGMLSIAEADSCKTILAANRYALAFESFADLL
jgi:predicted nucleic acid-binding protein